MAVDSEAAGPGSDGSSVDDDAAQRYVTEAGSALLRAAAPSYGVSVAVQTLARGYGLAVEIAAMPEGVLSVEESTGRSSLASARGGSLRFDQTQRLFELIQRTRHGGVPAGHGLGELRAIDQMPPTIPGWWRFVGYWLLMVGLCIRQNPGVSELVVTAVLALPVAGLLIGTPRLERLTPFVPAVAAFVVGVPVAVLVEHQRIAQPAHVVVPLLASFLPGLLLSVGSLELLRGALQAGAARFIGGIHQLMVLAFGLIGSEAAFALGSAPHPVAQTAHVGQWSPLAGVGIYAVGVCLAFCAPVSALPALAIVIYVAWGTQLLSDAVGGPYLSTFLGAALGVLVAQVFYTRFGPPPLLTLNPLFRILAPAGLGLLKVTSLSAGNFLGADFGEVVFTFIAVAMGLAAGMAVSERIRLRPPIAA